jgi:hypothetical protein
MKEHIVKWNVKLSDKTLYTEGVYPFDGESSSWNVLEKHVADNNLQVIELWLSTDNHTFYLNTAGTHPKFAAFRQVEQPSDYKVRRYLALDSQSGKEELYTVAIAVYPEYELQLWVNEKDPSESWVIANNGR